MVRVGIAGVGFMGWIHWLAYQKVDGIEVAAICTRDLAKRDGDWTSIKGNFGPPGEKVDLSNVAVYENLTAMVSDDTIDLIDICLPPSLHVDAVELAMNAGRHVFCEKPLALTSDECDRCMNSANDHSRMLLVGHVLPFFPEYNVALQAVQSSQYGRLLGGSFKRLISDPVWLDDFWDPTVVGGPMIDLHVHDAHWIRMLFGMPAEITCRGRFRGELLEYCHSTFGFDDPRQVVHSSCGVIAQQGRSFTHGFEIHFEKATMHFEFAGFADTGESMPLKILTDDGGVERPDLGDGDPINAFVAEIEEVKNAISSGKASEILDGQLARDAVALCHLQTEAARSTARL